MRSVEGRGDAWGDVGGKRHTVWDATWCSGYGDRVGHGRAIGQGSNVWNLSRGRRDDTMRGARR